MKKINVELTGITPLLMNSPDSMVNEDSQKLKMKTEGYNATEEAEKVAYRKEDGELYIPSCAIKGALINASSFKKIGKYAAKSIIAGGVFILESEIGLGTDEYEIDRRTVNIQRARIVKSRPVIKNWKVNFIISYNEKVIGNSTIIKDIFVDAGTRIGLLDFRPQKTGSFGMFEVTKWEEQ